MGLNIVEKIISAHLVKGELKQGEEIGIKIDQTLTQDATGTMVYLQFEAMGLARVKNELAVSYVDHNTVQVGPENANDHIYLQTVAAKYGIIFSRPGNGICHQLHLERFGKPGKTLLGSDSHTPTGGALGMIAIGAGGLDVALAMAGMPFYFVMPKVIKIKLKGRLRPWVSAKDIILKVLEMFSTKGNVDCVFEYGGTGVKNLSVPERATITNMGAECGVTTSVFPSDDVTKEFLEAQGRGKDWVELSADSDARYYKEVEIDLSSLEPLAAAPHSPGNIVTVSSLAGTKVGQVLIGSCTNSSYRDLKVAAKILEGKTVHPSVSAGVAFGSRQIMLMLAKEGLLSSLIKSGVRILENACGFCIGNSMSPASNGISLRTSNRNFEGRSGTPDAKVYIVSPETAAVAAVAGRVIDTMMQKEIQYPRIREPRQYEIDESMFLMPPEDSSGIEVIHAPGMDVVPRGSKLPDEISGVVAIKVGDKITTDHIMPAGQRLKYRSNIKVYSQYVFEGVDKDFAVRAAANRDKGLWNMIVAGESYGQGSSREHAALCPMYLGVKVILAKSFERIHFANLINFGILPLVFEKHGDYDKVVQGKKFVISGVRNVISGNGRCTVVMGDNNELNIPAKISLSERQKEIILAGGVLNMVAPAK
mgnify:CR=1 FL=1